MGFMDCLEKRLAEDELDPLIVERAEEIFENKMAKSPDGTDEMELAEQAIDTLEGHINREKMNELLQLNTRADLKDDLMNAYGEKDFVKLRGAMDTLSSGEALIGTLTMTRGEPTGIRAIEVMQENLRDKYFRTASDGLRKMAKQESVKGRLESYFREQEIDFKNVMRELNGEDVKLKASEKEFARGLRKGLNEAMLDYKMAGGQIQFMEDYIPNPIHDANAIRDVSKSEWIKQTKPLIDRQRMIKYDDQTVMTEDELDDLLDGIYENIRRNRPRDADLDEVRRGAFNKRQSDKRILHFKDTDAWLEYNDRFGKSVNAFDAITSRIERFAKDTAFMERFGPNPERGARVAKNIVAEHADEIGTNKATKGYESAIEEFDSIRSTMMGADRSAEQGIIADGVDNVNALAQAGTIGSAGPTVVAGDLSTQFYTALADGLPPGKIVASQVKNIINWSRAGNIQQVAAEAGFGADVWIQESLAQARFFGDVTTSDGPFGKAANFMSDKTTKYSGVSPWTSASRATWNVGFMKHLAKTSRLGWDELAEGVDGLGERIPGFNKVGKHLPKFKDTLERYNITRDDWAVLQDVENYSSTQFKKNFSYVDGDFEMLRPDDIVSEEVAERTGRTIAELRTLSDKVRQMIKTEEKFATPTATTRATETLRLNTESAWARKALNLTSMYKTFPMMIFQMHLPRIIQQGGTMTSNILGGSFLMTTTLAGMFSLQMGELSKGNNPRPFDDPNTWADAAARGGGLSFVGDQLFGDPTRYGSDIAGDISGPGLGLMSDVIELGQRGIRKAAGQETRFGRALSKSIKRWAPGGNIWYMRVPFERLVADNIQRFLDPEAQESFKRQIQYINSEFDQTSWSKPGKGLEGVEAPDLSEAFKDVEGGFTGR